MSRRAWLLGPRAVAFVALLAAVAGGLTMQRLHRDDPPQTEAAAAAPNLPKVDCQ